MNPEALRARNPFPGLRSFSADEADLFFGREAQIDELLRVADANPFVAVAGPSGCGKSSIVLAGLFKALTRRALTSSGAPFRPVVLRPGRQPIARLSEALARALGNADSPEAVGALYGRLRLSAVGLAEAVRLAALPAGERVIVVVDQFEEIFRFERISDPEEASAFVKLLLHVALEPMSSLRVVITLRSDALGNCADFPGLAEAVSRGLMLVPKLTRDQRKEAIVGPVRQCGFDVRPSLVQRILNDVPDDYDDLPVMQHALSRTWWFWAANSPDGSGGAGARELAVEDYESIGGSRDALDRHGQRLLDELTPKLQGVAERVMRALTERRPDGTEVRRPLRFDELCGVVCRAGTDTADVAAVVDHLRSADACFLRPPPDELLSTNPPIDITHESLIRQWTSLRGWVQAEAESRIELDKLLDAAQRHAEGKGDLWKGRQLKEALDWLGEEVPGEAWVRLVAGAAGAARWPQAQQFIASSSVEARAERRRRAVVVWGGAALALVLFGALGLTAFTMSSFDKANRQRLSQEIANLGWHELRLDPAISAHLSIAALNLDKDNPQAEQVLRQSVETLLVSRAERIVDFGSPIADARPNHDGTRIAVVGGDQLAIIDAQDPKAEVLRQTLPWRANSVWLLDKRGLVVLKSEGQEGLRIQTPGGQGLADWNCPGGDAADFVYSVQASPDGRWLAAGCLKGQLALWALPEQAGPIGPPAVLTAGKGATVTAITFAKDGRWLASGDADGQVLLWKVADSGKPWIGSITPERVDSPIHHALAIRDLDLWENDAGSFLATASDDGSARVWKLDVEQHRLAKAVGTEKTQWNLAHGRPVIYARADTMARVMTVTDRRLQFWEDETAMAADTHHNSWITDADVSAKGDYAVSASDDGIARVWSRDRDPIATLVGHRDAVTRSRFIGADRIITASNDGTLRLWRIAPVRTLHSSPGRWVLTVAPSPDGKELAFCGESGVVPGGHCGLLSLAGEAGNASPPTSIESAGGERVDAIGQLLWSSDGSRLFAGAGRYDLGGSGVLPLEWTRGETSVMTLQAGTLVLDQSAARSESARISREGELSIQLQTSGDTAPVATFKVPGRYFGQAAALSADGRWVAATEDKAVWLFDRRQADGAPRALQGHQGTVMSLAFSPDGRYLASAGADRNAKLWPLESADGTLPTELTGGHSAAIYKLAFNRAGSQIATASADGTVRMWDARSGRELVTFEWHSAAVNDLRFHPTDGSLFTASDDGTVKRGRCRTCDLSVAQLRQKVIDEDLGQLTPRDRDYVLRAGKEGGRAKR